MKVIVKILKGPECTLEVNDGLSVGELKDKIHERLHVQPRSQRLVYKGKTLSDTKQLCEYGVQEESKIFVTVKEVTKDTESPPILAEELDGILQKHFTEENAAVVAQHFHTNLQETLKNMSLDDIERYARHILDCRKSKSSKS